jgi:sulfoquinovosyltransferase
MLTPNPHAALLQGMLKGEDLSAAYASADIFVMPSESETLGFVAMEVC